MTVDTKAVAGLLREAREQQGLTIKDVAQDICVRSTYLEAMEAGDFDALPAQTFAIGFVKSYATALKLDADAVVAAFKRETGYAQKATAPVTTTQSSAITAIPKSGLPSWLAPFAGILGVGLCWVAFGPNLELKNFESSGARINAYQEEQKLKSVTAQLNSLVIEVAEIEVMPNSAISSHSADLVEEQRPTLPRSLFATAAYANENSALINSDASTPISLTAIEDSWVRLGSADGSEVWSGILKAGESYRPGFSGTLTLATSNAGGVQVKISEADPYFLGERGEMVTDVVLKPEEQSHAAYSSGISGSR